MVLAVKQEDDGRDKGDFQRLFNGTVWSVNQIQYVIHTGVEEKDIQINNNVNECLSQFHILMVLRDGFRDIFDIILDSPGSLTTNPISPASPLKYNQAR